MSSTQSNVTEQDVKDLMGSLKTLRSTLPPGQQTALDALVRRALSDDDVSGYDYSTMNFSMFNQNAWPSYELGGYGYPAGEYDPTAQGGW